MTGVDRYTLVAIWGRETAYGSYHPPNDAIRVLATLAYTGKRKDKFRDELIAALKMLQSGIPRSDMKSSWAGAIGLTQAMPTEYFKYATDGDGDGKIDIWRSVADALAFTARQLEGKGWDARRALGLRGAGAAQIGLLARRTTRRSADRRLGALGIPQGRKRALQRRRSSSRTPI